MTPHPQFKVIPLYSVIQDEDGYVSNVPMCLCEHCGVNQFLCPKHTSQQSERDRVLDEVLKSLDKKESAYKFIRAKFVLNDKNNKKCPHPRSVPACKMCYHENPHKINESCFSRCFFGQTCTDELHQQGKDGDQG